MNEENPNMSSTLKAYREELLSLLNKSQDTFEKQLSYISSGSIGVSMLLVEKLFPNLSNVSCKFILVLGWIILATTLMINLISHLHTFRCHSKTIKEIDDCIYLYSKAKRRNNLIVIINWISAVLLFIGILLIIIFVSRNM